MSRTDIALQNVRDLLRAGQATRALPMARQAVQHSPKNLDATILISEVELVLNNMPAAEYWAKCACGLAPGEPRVWVHLAAVQRSANRTKEALASQRKALSIAPGNPLITAAVASTLLELKSPFEALTVVDAALAAHPSNTTLLGVRASALFNAARCSEAAATLRTILRASPGGRGASASWSGLSLVLNYDPDATPQEQLEAHRAFGSAIAAEVSRPSRSFALRHTPLRVGFVSPDFRTHPVATFLEPLLRSIDRSKFVLFLYHTNRIVDDTTARFRQIVGESGWRLCDTLPDHALAAKIASDELDICIDLSGHTQAHALGAIHLKPAPVLATFLGYPNTTGLDAVDFRIVDSNTDPSPNADGLAVEKLIRIDPCFLCYSMDERAIALIPDVSPLPFHSRGAITFGSLNSVFKINERVMRVWSRVLAEVPQSRLLLKSLNFADAALRDDLARRFAAHGVDADRLTLLSPKDDAFQHLCTYGQIDIALDTFPYHGTTTTCEALAMGVPVVSLEGATHASRVGVSLLRAVGHPEWIATTEDSYVGIAKGLASNIQRLDQVRASLRETMRASPLCDLASYTRRFEAALLSMVDQSGLATNQ